MSHNALRQIEIKSSRETLQGFSISGLATYLQVPELDVCFDMGECPLSALKLDHVFLTHAHGDHSRCLMRHHSLRRMTGIEKPAVYYMPDFLVEPAQELVRAEARFEGVPPHRFELPKFVGLIPGGPAVPLTYRKDLEVQAFSVKHSIPSVGFTLFDCKKKLLPEYQGTPGTEIARLRKSGTEVSSEVREPRLTFIGDCIGSTLRDQAHIWDSRVLIIETTFLDPEERKMAREKGHTHLDELLEVLHDMPERVHSELIVLKHFSMKYSRNQILEKVTPQLPEAFRDRIQLLV